MEIKSKEEMFNEIIELPFIVSHKDAAMELAEQYADIESCRKSVDFAEWIIDSDASYSGDKLWDYQDKTNLTTAQLYQLYRESQQPIP